MFLKNIELYKKYKNHGALRKKEETEVINFGFSKPDNEKFFSSTKAFIDFIDSIDQKENII